MSKAVGVLAVPHPLQGPGFRGYVNDPHFSRLVTGLMTDVDFVFEEASGNGPSTAEELAKTILGAGHYLDVDPAPSERPPYGIGETGGRDPIDPMDERSVLEWADIGENRKREELWVTKVLALSFENGLAICGLAYALSFAFRLRSAGIGIAKSYTYIPYHKLCTRSHAN